MRPETDSQPLDQLAWTLGQLAWTAPLRVRRRFRTTVTTRCKRRAARSSAETARVVATTVSNAESYDYDDAYRLTFLSHERVIVAPDKGVNRYPPYRRKVEAAPDRVRIERVTSGADAAAPGDVLCRTPLLMARLIPK